jgi:hypothetical protein
MSSPGLYRRHGFALLLVLLSSLSFAQNDSARIAVKAPAKAFSSEDRKFSIALRGKAFGFVIIEDNYFSTVTIGTELCLKGRHSLGIDFTYFGWQYETDNSQDSPLYETYERRTYAYFDYRYRFLAYKSIDLYVNLYDKIGTYHEWRDGVAEGYNFLEKPFLNNKTDGTFNQAGLGIGIKKYAKGGRFYVDLSANVGKLFTNNNTVTYNDSLNIIDRKYGVQNDRTIFYMRLNLGYKLFVKK